jgi:hypothetical protein
VNYLNKLRHRAARRLLFAETQTRPALPWHDFLVEKRPDPRIIKSDRLDNAIVVAFDDGTTALYSAALLYATLSQARVLESSASEREDIPHSSLKP